jgi:hypothetical protein
MKKSNIILALILTWLAVFSLVITPALAIKWPYFDHVNYEVEGNDEKKINVYDLYDHHITFEYYTTFGLPVSMLFIYKTADTAYRGNFTDISDENMTILDPILRINATELLETTEKWRVPDREIYEIVFVNRNSEDANVTLTIIKEEIGTISYYFGAICSVVFFISLLFIIRKRSKYNKQNNELEAEL